MPDPTQIITASWIVPVDDAQSVLTEHAVVIADDKIIAILPRTDAVAQYGPLPAKKSRANEIEWHDLPQHILIPGFINAHTHAAMTLLRGYADDLPLMQWLTEHIWPAEAKWVNAEFVRAGTELACAEMLLGGTTCFNDMYFFPEVVAECVTRAKMRACIGLIVLDVPSVWASNADEYINKGLALHDQLRHSPLLSVAFAPHAPYTVGDAALQRLATLSAELGCPVHIHLHETAPEVAQAVTKTGARPLARLAQLGLLNDQLIAVHMTQLLPAEIQVLAERGVSVVHCPQSNMKLASGFCPLTDLMAAGVNIAIGTDGAASNNDLDMLSELQTAAMLAKGVSGDPTTFAAHTALAAATLGGARALGLAAQTGSLAVGKQADLVAVDLSAWATQPTYHPLSQLVYSASREQVREVWVAGTRVVRAGELCDVDTAQLAQQTEQWRAQIATTP